MATGCYRVPGGIHTYMELREAYECILWKVLGSGVLITPGETPCETAAVTRSPSLRHGSGNDM
jgi:hypothetical protein